MPSSLISLASPQEDTVPRGEELRYDPVPLALRDSVPIGTSPGMQDLRL